MRRRRGSFRRGGRRRFSSRRVGRNRRRVRAMRIGYRM